MDFKAVIRIHIFQLTSSLTRFHSFNTSNFFASCSELMWDFLPWPSRLSERALWTSPHATWIILWAFCCARLSAQWTCLPAWHPSTCHCGRASQAPCSSLASWCTCSTGSTHLGSPWDLCLQQRCTTPCGSCTARLYNKVRKQDRGGETQVQQQQNNGLFIYLLVIFISHFVFTCCLSYVYAPRLMRSD